MKHIYTTLRALYGALAFWFLFAPPPTAGCTGDCNNDAEVTIDEIVTMVNIALGAADVTTCATGDANTDGEITIDEIIRAVGFALTSCPPTGACKKVQVTVQLDFDPNSVPDLAGISLQLAFRSSLATLPPDRVSDNIEDVSGSDGFFDAQLVPANQEPFDQSLNLSYVASLTLNPGPLVLVTFDCAGSAAPTSQDFACYVTGASDSGGFPALGDVRCRAEVLPPGQGFGKLQELFGGVR